MAAGVFLALDTHVETQMGFRLLLPMFAAAILGGIGKPYGAVAGGLVIGIVEELSAYPWIGTAPLLSPGYKAGIAFAHDGRHADLAAAGPGEGEPVLMDAA